MTLPFPADSAEYEEYQAVMNEMADEVEETVGDEPNELGFTNAEIDRGDYEYDSWVDRDLCGEDDYRED